MILDDLSRPGRRARIVRNAAILCATLALVYAGWLTYQNDRLSATNAELAHWVTEKIEGLENELAALRTSEAQLMDALEPRAAVLRSAEDK